MPTIGIIRDDNREIRDYEQKAKPPTTRVVLIVQPEVDQVRVGKAIQVAMDRLTQCGVPRKEMTINHEELVGGLTRITVAGDPDPDIAKLLKEQREALNNAVGIISSLHEG